ncbi:uncharacterized protein LOC119996067 [Tripterygium wilfordii]|uniref:uncharacterized protein LOC119996067 n=1 Tax=Tripterygium wilfordii TaxID=458696 RepID=UPI0018F7EB6F|nr:uncharacterized protein LOC119996067 [Tripterygium wilfordii]
MECQLQDLGYKGNMFTWSNRRRDPNSFIKERLDRAVANHEWLQRWEHYLVHHVKMSSSDHSCIYVFWDPSQIPRRRRTTKFKYDPGWGCTETCKELVRQHWVVKPMRSNGHNALSHLKHNLGRCGPMIQQWVVKDKQKQQSTLKKLNENLENLIAEESHENQEAISSVRSEVNRIREDEEKALKNLSKQHWFMAGAQNTSFFHSSMKQRR